MIVHVYTCRLENCTTFSLGIENESLTGKDILASPRNTNCALFRKEKHCGEMRSNHAERDHVIGDGVIDAVAVSHGQGSVQQPFLPHTHQARHASTSCACAPPFLAKTRLE